MTRSSQVRDVAVAAYDPWVTKTDIAEMRAGFDEMLPAPLPDVFVEATELGGTPGEWLTVPSGGVATIFYLHGGGGIVGSAAGYRGLVGRIAAAAGARAVVVDYALAPEARFPVAYDQALAAYRALIARADVDPASLVVIGDSFGGGLAAAILQSLRDAGDPLPAAAALLSPYTDLTMSAETWETRADADPLITRSGAVRSADLYLGGTDAADPRVSPLHGDLSGLPPLQIDVGDAECLLDDSVRLAEKAEAAGVGVDLRVWPGMVHVFPMFCEQLPEGVEAIERLGAFVRARAAS